MSDTARLWYAKELLTEDNFPLGGVAVLRLADHLAIVAEMQSEIGKLKHSLFSRLCRRSRVGSTHME